MAGSLGCSGTYNSPLYKTFVASSPHCYRFSFSWDWLQDEWKGNMVAWSKNGITPTRNFGLNCSADLSWLGSPGWDTQRIEPWRVTKVDTVAITGKRVITAQQASLGNSLAEMVKQWDRILRPYWCWWCQCSGATWAQVASTCAPRSSRRRKSN